LPLGFIHNDDVFAFLKDTDSSLHNLKVVWEKRSNMPPVNISSTPWWSIVASYMKTNWTVKTRKRAMFSKSDESEWNESIMCRDTYLHFWADSDPQAVLEHPAAPASSSWGTGNLGCSQGDIPAQS
jgi:hypothetical protein